VFYQNPPVLNWGAGNTGCPLYGYKMVVVVVAAAAAAAAVVVGE